MLILGAGIAGLVSAWELSRVGYDCVVVEARRRAGGRNWTIRNGTRVEMTDGTTQLCILDEPNYFNAGPARLPSQHRSYPVQPGIVDSRHERIIQPDGPIFFAGDHTSHLVGWQEGAALSAHRAVSLLSQAQSARRATTS